MIEWRFKPNSRDDMDVDPIQGEFFTTRDIDNISTAVVREGIQNALDERNREGQSETVKVRIFLSGDKYALSKEEYQEKLKLVTMDQKIATRRETFQNFLKKNPKKYIHGTQIENSNGDDLYNVKNVKSSFSMLECEDCAYCDLLITSKNCMDVSSL